MARFKAGSFYDGQGASEPVVGQVKTMRHQSPSDHGRWHRCADPNTEEPRTYSKADYPLLFAAIGTRMNASITDPMFDPDTHFAGLYTQLGDTYDDYHDFVYVDAQDS